MARQIEIEWVPLGIKVVADLHEEKNPGICDLLWSYLPYHSVQNHALISGQHLYHYNPILESFFTTPEVKESRAHAPVGTVFLSYLLHLSMKYGFLTEDLPAAPVAQIREECLEDFKRAGAAIWESTYRNKELIEVRVTKKGEAFDPAAFSIRDYGAVEDPQVAALIQEIRDETARIWATPPEELVDIHAGRIKSRAGAYSQYFTTMVFVNGEERHLGYNALGGLLKTCKTSDISLEVLQQITANFVAVPAEFLGYCGLETMASFCERMLHALPRLKSKDEYYALLAPLTLYINRMNGWNLQFFPWKHGEEYKYEDVL